MAHKNNTSQGFAFMTTFAWVLSAWPGLIQAQSVATRKATQGLAPDPLDALHLSNYFVGIVIVFLILGIASWYLRRYQTGIGRGPIRVQSSLQLGGKERIMVVEINGRQLLLGVSPAGINLLQVLDGETQNAGDNKQATTTLAKESLQTDSRSWLQRTLKSVANS